jgi:hypothetical protein
MPTATVCSAAHEVLPGAKALGYDHQQMPLYLIERTFAEQLDLTSDDVKLIEDVNEGAGVNWLFSFLSADRHRSYCLYEAPSPDAIVEAARLAQVPVDKVVEVSRFVPAEVRA